MTKNSAAPVAEEKRPRKDWAPIQASCIVSSCTRSCIRSRQMSALPIDTQNRSLFLLAFSKQTETPGKAPPVDVPVGAEIKCTGRDLYDSCRWKHQGRAGQRVQARRPVGVG